MASNKKKTIIFGGAFNPPTIAHEKILAACVDWALENNAEIWIMPSGNRTDKKINTQRSVRLNYINAMIDGVDLKNFQVKIHLGELDRGHYIETYDSYMELVKSYRQRDFIWVYGSDAVETMLSWKMGQWLMDNMEIILIERRDLLLRPLKTVHTININMPHVSSTDVRYRLSNGMNIDEVVSGLVKRAIAKTPPGESEVFVKK
jgi:nicotinate (nicotinamide) nucleotide adenylyltransferase